MWWCSTQGHCVVFWLHISLTITEREPIYRWERTRPSRARLSYEKWAESQRCRRSAVFIIATSEAPPEWPEPITAQRPRHPLKSASPTGLRWACVRLQFDHPTRAATRPRESLERICLRGKQQSP